MALIERDTEIPLKSSLTQHYDLNSRLEKNEEDDLNVDHNHINTPRKYVPLDRIYSASSLCVSSTSVSKKVKARILMSPSPPPIRVYSRRPKRDRDRDCSRSPPSKSFYDSLLARGEDGEENSVKKGKKRRIGSGELVKLGVDSDGIGLDFDKPRLRDCRGVNFTKNGDNVGLIKKKKKKKPGVGSDIGDSVSLSVKSRKWVRLSFDGADPKKFVGLQCQVFWPLDADWYRGRVVGYNSENNRHHIEYADGDKEDLILSNEKIKFLISHVEMQKLNLSASVKGSNHDDYDYNEMLALAASLDDCQDLEPGDIIWAKLTGHAMWPAVVVDASLICNHKGLNKNSDERSVYVQFFGTHDFARVKPKQVISFLKGLLSSFHLKCKRPHFTQSLEEAKLYLSEQKLPRRMLQLQSGMKSDSCVTVSSEDSMATDSDEDCLKDEGIQRILNGLKNSPYMIGDLQIISLGKIVNDSEYFQDGKFIWPEGYTASRKFTSLTDPGTSATYKMEVLRDAESKIRPIFLVTVDNGEQIKGSTPSACWNKIYKRMRKMQDTNSNGSSAKGGEGLYESGADMFGFSNPEVFELIKGLSKARTSSKSSCKSTFKAYEGLPVGYRPVRVDWKDLDKCSVCHMDEEYENNLFLQCDKCRIMVHSRCYGELKPSDGELWLCNLCRPGAPESSPPCCLCPVIGGAMKPTTDGRWAHLACAIWIPETCLLDIKRMEPIDGLNRISKDRWKLLCRICGVAYGACIQCSNNNCRVAYHPLCARAAGLCVELEDEDRLHLLSVDDEEESQCIRLLSFCKKHRPSNERSVMEERIGQITRPCSDYIPPCNPSGCARTEPYNFSGRRGRKEPEALAAASLKRLFVENQPYLVGGNCQHESGNKMHSNNLQRFNALQVDSPNNILSVAEKYDYMRQTFRKRLAFGKSGIHGFGIFAKHPHKAGDMVIEYTGELVRPPIADRREHLIYNSLVGAGTYMFRIDDERVIDATRAGSIAHLINHSCEPNCYSRVISVNGDEHIIIFAKRDIKRWEELTYDYRFFSIDEQLPCYCGFPRCRGVVNDTEERPAKLYVPRSELTD